MTGFRGYVSGWCLGAGFGIGVMGAAHHASWRWMLVAIALGAVGVTWAVLS